MRRFRRWIFNGLAVVSLMLCVVTVGLWVRSYWKADGIERDKGWEVSTSAGVDVHWTSIQFISNRHGIIIASFRGFGPSDIALCFCATAMCIGIGPMTSGRSSSSTSCVCRERACSLVAIMT